MWISRGYKYNFKTGKKVYHGILPYCTIDNLDIRVCLTYVFYYPMVPILILCSWILAIQLPRRHIK